MCAFIKIRTIIVDILVLLGIWTTAHVSGLIKLFYWNTTCQHAIRAIETHYIFNSIIYIIWIAIYIYWSVRTITPLLLSFLWILFLFNFSDYFRWDHQRIPSCIFANLNPSGKNSVPAVFLAILYHKILYKLRYDKIEFCY